MNPLISICIPTYNGEKYLKACLDSCLAQNFTDYEIIVCDDQSSDSTLQIVEEYRQKHTSIKIFSNEFNLGLVKNWNRCIELATGTWIKFLFQDDLMYADCLQKFADQFTSGKPLIVSKRNFILEKESILLKNYYESEVRTLENTGFFESNRFSAQQISKIAIKNIALNFIAEPSLVIFKKELVNQCGTFDEELKQICDLEFFLRVASVTGLTYIPEKLCEFRIHSQSTTEKNVGGISYHHAQLESLIFAAKLLSTPQFGSFRNFLSVAEKIKLRLYVKYKSFIAYRNITSPEDQQKYDDVRLSYGKFFFKKVDLIYLQILFLLKSR